jgi:hypothetical protein
VLLDSGSSPCRRCRTVITHWQARRGWYAAAPRPRVQVFKVCRDPDCLRLLLVEFLVEANESLARVEPTGQRTEPVAGVPPDPRLSDLDFKMTFKNNMSVTTAMPNLIWKS